MRASYLVFGQPKIEEAEIEEVVATLRSGWIGSGPKVTELERRFAEYCQVAEAVAVSSCTAGLHLSLQALGAGPGTSVITTPFTFAATMHAIVHSGARPLLVDIERDSANIDPDGIAALLANDCVPDPRSGRPHHRESDTEVVALLPVHFAGRPCDMDRISALAEKYRLAVIEDAAHAIEAWYHGRKIGGLGDLGCFSFYATKSMTTGEGGMITTRSREQAQRLRTLALQGLSKDAWGRASESGGYRVIAPGYKYNMTDIAASLGLHQIRRLASGLQRRADIWTRYDEAFRHLPLTLPAAPEANTIHARHLYTLLVDRDRAGIDRDTFRERLHRSNIGTGVHFISLHLHDFYRDYFRCAPEDFANALYVSERTVSLPLTAHLTDQDVDDVIEAVTAALR